MVLRDPQMYINYYKVYHNAILHVNSKISFFILAFFTENNENEYIIFRKFHGR